MNSTGTALVLYRKSICNPFPMDRGYIAQIVVPRDMSRQEAERLAECIKALAQPDNS
jgi:hypothetical protein